MACLGDVQTEIVWGKHGLHLIRNVCFFLGQEELIALACCLFGLDGEPDTIRGHIRARDCSVQAFPFPGSSAARQAVEAHVYMFSYIVT